MLRVLLYIFLIYLAYQFVFKFLIPLFNTTQQLRKGFHEMNNRMNATNEERQDSSSQRTQNSSTPKGKVGEYIDFEDIK